jgi:hypothetical protein
MNGFVTDNEFRAYLYFESKDASQCIGINRDTGEIQVLSVTTHLYLLYFADMQIITHSQFVSLHLLISGLLL